MSANIATLHEYLGPASVIRVEGATPICAVPEGGEVRAELALAFPYEPTAGDELLVIGKRDRYWVIGVLRARGEVSLRFMGDVRLHAVGGRLSLQGDQGVRVRGETVEVVARELKTLAESIVERAGDVFRRVRGLCNLHAREQRVLVDGLIATRAESMQTATSGIVSINGKEIHLA